MRRDPIEERASRGSVVIKYLTGTMAVLYILFGTAILLTYASKDHEEFYNRLGPYPWGWIGIALLLYGIFRAYKVYQQYFRPQE